MTIKEIDAALEEGQSLKTIAQAYSEIANLKIKRIRSEVERNTLFFQEIAGVYTEIKKFAAGKKIKIVKPKKTVSIVLSSNYRFYGNINSDLLDFFARSTQKMDTDAVMVNKAAINYFRATKKRADYQEILLKGDQPDALELTSLVNMLKDYNQVLVFYSSLKSLLVQLPKVVDITASSQSHLEGVKTHLRGDQPEFRFIFEPQLPKILQFFDSQMITLLLEATFLESELARTASRFISMDQAETEANKLIKQYRQLKAYAKSNLDNNKILENYASMMAFRKEVYG